MRTRPRVSARSRRAGGEEGPGDGALPPCYPFVAADIVRLCRPRDGGVWVDLGAGPGPVGLALLERCRSRIVLVDPNAESLSAARQEAADRGVADRIELACGRAEALPFADQSVDLVVSRGSIYFWDDQPRGIAEVYRVLREGGQAMIGGGLGRDYPHWARQEFIRRRHEGVQRKGPEAYAEFLRLRQPDTFAAWAQQAGVPSFEVEGEGGRPPGDPSAGLGIWLRFGRQGVTR